MANFIGTVLHWYKKRVPNFTTQSNKKCAYNSIILSKKYIFSSFKIPKKKFCIVTIQTSQKELFCIRIVFALKFLIFKQN